MMKFKKPNNKFDTAGFVEVLNHFGIPAQVVENGFEFDIDVFKSKKSYEYSHWVYMNREWLLSEY